MTFTVGGTQTMQALNSGDLTIEHSRHGPETIRLDWKGRSNARRPDEAINPFLSDVLEQARTGTAGIDMHFETLEYLNSSTVGVLVQFLHKARAGGVPLSFSYAPSVRWQKLSFEALRVFEQMDQRVRVIAVEGA